MLFLDVFTLFNFAAKLLLFIHKQTYLYYITLCSIIIFICTKQSCNMNVISSLLRGRKGKFRTSVEMLQKLIIYKN